MRILHFLAERGYSGGEVQLRFLVEHLHRQGHRNALALVPGAQFAAVSHELGLDTFEVDLRHPVRPSTVRAVRAAVAAFAPEIIHFGCGRSLLWAGWWLRGIRGPVKLTTRRIDYPIGRGRCRGGRYRSLVDHVIANCENVRRQVLAAGVPAARVSLIHEGLDLRRWQVMPDRAAARAKLGLPGDALVVTCAATLRPRKGQRLLLHAFATIAARWPNARLVLAGSGPDAGALARLAARLRIAPQVWLPGRVDPIADLWSASDVGCLVSKYEGLANACLEASAAGLPLIVSRAGGLPEIVEDGVTGAVVPSERHAVAVALTRYFGDPQLRERAGRAGAARTSRLFPAQRMVEKTEALLAELLARHACTPT